MPSWCGYQSSSFVVITLLTWSSVVQVGHYSLIFVDHRLSSLLVIRQSSSLANNAQFGQFPLFTNIVNCQFWVVILCLSVSSAVKIDNSPPCCRYRQLSKLVTPHCVDVIFDRPKWVVSLRSCRYRRLPKFFCPAQLYQSTNTQVGLYRMFILVISSHLNRLSLLT